MFAMFTHAMLTGRQHRLLDSTSKQHIYIHYDHKSNHEYCRHPCCYDYFYCCNHHHHYPYYNYYFLLSRLLLLSSSSLLLLSDSRSQNENKMRYFDFFLEQFINFWKDVTGGKKN